LFSFPTIVELKFILMIIPWRNRKLAIELRENFHA